MLTPDQFQPHMDAIDMAHAQTSAQYQKLKKSDSTLKQVRDQLEKLTLMGDAVTQDDVVDAAGHLVGHGLGAMPMAELLASMPPDGQALQSWVAQHMQGLVGREQQLNQAKTAMQHKLGTSALHLLTAHHVGLGQANGPQPQPQPGQASPQPAAGPMTSNALGGAMPNG